MSSNKVLPIVAGLVLLMLIFVGVKSCSQDNTVASRLSAVPVPGSPDADSTNDTIRTLTAEVANIRSESKKLTQQNESLLKQRNDIEASVKSQLFEQLRKENVGKESSVISQFTEQLNFFRTRLDEINNVQNQLSEQDGSDIPIGFGINPQDELAAVLPDIIWVEPLGREAIVQGQTASITNHTTLYSGDSLLQTSNKTESSQTEKLIQGMMNPKIKDKPAYTIPRNSTLIGSTGMTALIGRIPTGGAIEDAFPFKVIVGKDNLAANVITMPGLDGMIFSGKATGDWALSCVRGQLHSVTYVFSDGTIRTLSSDETGSSNNKLQQAGSGAERSLGWISDRRGIPCVTGTRISNAMNYLSGRILASAAEAAAGAFSQNEVTNTVSALGGVATSVITGDAAKFAAGKALSGGASEISEYLRERQAQSFDAIYVDTGAELAIHIDIELPIDYEQDGRKTSYDTAENTEYSDLD
jgi:integrating conjugative element protein (TIGR03752 family)